MAKYTDTDPVVVSLKLAEFSFFNPNSFSILTGKTIFWTSNEREFISSSRGKPTHQLASGGEKPRRTTTTANDVWVGTQASFTADNMHYCLLKEGSTVAQQPFYTFYTRLLTAPARYFQDH